MDAYLLEWGGLLLRWLHMITAIAWIGSSFFFMHLDALLRKAPGLPAQAGGVAWQVHGGGFYEMRKYLVAPERLPEELTWHKWQSYWTWISGFFLLVWIYYGQSSLYLIDPAIMQMTPAVASVIGIGSLAVGWLAYDQLCKSPLGSNDVVLAAIGFAFVVAASWGFASVFSGRGALIHTGALMATLMSANVFLIIIPNQKKVIADLVAGRSPDPALGKQGKQRSTHNNYLTLPVLFLMLSNHYPTTYGNAALIPLLVALVLIAGGLVRHFYNIRHADHARSPWWALGAAALAMGAAVAAVIAVSPLARNYFQSGRVVPSKTASSLAAPPAPVVDIIVSRCSMCHAAEPVWNGIHVAPKGVVLDSAETIRRQAEAIRLHAVLTHAMPPNNVTEMPIEERQAVAAWLSGQTAENRQAQAGRHP
ncbi:MAG: urate hydroxylase PuuD [Xanthobacteraceae bacterium]|nr:urate hydroxylase PuuD [Xanthobacteraceae bacterium]